MTGGRDRTEPDDALGHRVEWTLAGISLASLTTLAVCYVTDPDLDRVLRNIPVLPDSPGIEEPFYIVLWAAALGSLGALGAFLWADSWRRRRTARRTGDQLDRP